VSGLAAPAARPLVVELLWSAGCPNREATRRVLQEVLAEHVPRVDILEIDATDPQVAAAVGFPGSPTIRVNGVDVDASFEDPGDYTPRCRLYRTGDGYQGVPPREWIVDAVRLRGV
jgi:hypothetical protein